MSRPTVFCDLDDTLIQTCQIYREAHRAAALLIADAIMLGPALVGVRIDRIDRENATKLGFGKDRFPNSLVETYRSYLKEYPVLQLSPYLEHALRAIGHAVYTTEAPKFPDTVEALERLADTHDILLVTKGDHEVQSRRIRQSGLGTFFPEVYVVERKDADVYRAILKAEGLRADLVTMIGDSMASDINPALEVGMGAIQVVYGTADWAFEHAEATGHFHKVASLSAAVALVQEEERFIQDALDWGIFL